MVIYRIVCFSTGKSYIGQTVNNPNRRYQQHMAKLANGKHHSRKLQRAYNKYGKDAFFFEVIEVCDDVEMLNNREIYWIEQFNSFISGFNATKGGDGHLSRLTNKEKVELILKKNEQINLIVSRALKQAKAASKLEVSPNGQ